ECVRLNSEEVSGRCALQKCKAICDLSRIAAEEQVFLPEPLRFYEGRVFQIFEQTEHFILEVNIERGIRIQMQSIECVEVRHSQFGHQLSSERIRCFPFHVGNRLWRRSAWKKGKAHRFNAPCESTRNRAVGGELPRVKIHPR